MTSLFVLTILMLILVLYILYVRSGSKICDPNISMVGRVVIVTGGNAGIGFHTALDLARRGARVILACRDETRGTAAQNKIRTTTGNNNVHFKKLDLASLDSVKKFAINVIENEFELHVLINNAGVSTNADSMTEDGIVSMMQINYYGHFLLTLLLLPLLKKSQPSRIINLSSNLHFFGDFNQKTINQISSNATAYSNSKFCMLLFALELSRKLQGTGVVSNAVHPGVIYTDITTNNHPILKFLFWIWCCMYGRSVEQGAQGVVYLAVTEECGQASGKYYVDCETRLRSWRTYNRRKAKALWTHSEKLVGYEYDHEKLL